MALIHLPLSIPLPPADFDRELSSICYLAAFNCLDIDVNKVVSRKLTQRLLVTPPPPIGMFRKSAEEFKFLRCFHDVFEPR